LQSSQTTSLKTYKPSPCLQLLPWLPAGLLPVRLSPVSLLSGLPRDETTAPSSRRPPSTRLPSATPSSTYGSPLNSLDSSLKGVAGSARCSIRNAHGCWMVNNPSLSPTFGIKRLQNLIVANCTLD
jgi:hypothetical protein